MRQAPSSCRTSPTREWLPSKPGTSPKKNPDKMYVLFEQRMQVQETCHMTPFKAVQKPADEDEVVNVKIEPMKKGKKPKE